MTMAASDLLTVPQPLTQYELYLPIANEYVALPAVRRNGWIDSADDPHPGPAGRFQAASCGHAPYSWTLSLANMVLSGRGDRAAEILRSASLNGGLACVTFDVETGLPKTGRHFATCAGFLGYALYAWLKAEC